MFCFGILRIFGKNRKSANLENLGIIGLLRCSVGNSRRDIDLRQGMGYPRHGEAEVPKWHPSVLHRGVATVHNEQFFLNFYFQAPRIRTPIV